MLKALLLAAVLSTPQAQRTQWKAPYEILPLPENTASYVAQLGTEPSRIIHEGDLLTVLYKAPGDAVLVGGAFSAPMKKVPGTEDIWMLQLRMPNWNEALMSLFFFTPTNPIIDAKNIKVFQGKDAPAAPVKAEKLTGTITEHTIKSEAAGEDRKVKVYLPPDAPKSGLAAIFMADGQGADGMAKVLEPLILAKKIRPVAIIGSYSGEYKGDRSKPYDPKLDFRALEYIHHEKPETFEKHMKFFATELPKWATEKFGISDKREDRAVFGFSNGGAFAAAAGTMHGDVFGHAFPFSLGVPFQKDPKGPLPKYHFVAGKMESFHLRTQTQYDQVKKWGADATYDLYMGGHDPIIWELGLGTVVQRVWPGPG